MSIRIRVGLSRKVGEPHFSSRGASIELEAEIDNQVAGDPDQFHQKVQVLYSLARRSLDAELDRHPHTTGLITPTDHQTSGGQTGDLLHNNQQPSDRFAAGPTGGSLAGGGRNDQGPVPETNQRSGVPTVTQSQLRAIYALSKRQQLDPGQCAMQQFGKPRIENLTIREASQLIDLLKKSLSMADA